MENKLYITLLFSLLIIPLISAEQQTLGTFKQNDCIQLLQSCSNCTVINISGINYPNGSLATGYLTMTHNNNGMWNRTYCTTSALGQYIVSGNADVDGENTVFVYDFEITKNGSKIGQDYNPLLIGLGIIALALLAITFLISNDMSYLKDLFLSGALFTTLIIATFAKETFFNEIQSFTGLSNAIYILLITIFSVWIIFLLVRGTMKGFEAMKQLTKNKSKIGNNDNDIDKE